MVKIRKEVHITESDNLTQLLELYHQQQQEQQQTQRRIDPASPEHTQQIVGGGSDQSDHYRTFTQQQQQQHEHELQQDQEQQDTPGTVDDQGTVVSARNLDEDDASDDYEQSGNYILYSNHTTIQLDPDETEPH